MLPYEKLTNRERHAIDLIAAFGLSDRQIALAMQISENTVGRYLHSAMEKIGLSTRLEVAKWRLSR